MVVLVCDLIIDQKLGSFNHGLNQEIHEKCKNIQESQIFGQKNERLIEIEGRWTQQKARVMSISVARPLVDVTEPRIHQK
ncbi:hypothetical protein L2E82_30486 [Cichorium intybus]|uniref:Uncharacterized protein n=1 Tax=Cichorium intybus TaxID=13427 RepID=A0ACB9D0U1_CICIN|nr:hypothetical protein L2E82_30486 [Cichorium intybus]